MLSFTYQEAGRIRATYNGRFAFMACDSQRELERLIKQNAHQKHPHWERTNTANQKPVDTYLQHEFRHQQLFQHSPSGLTLSGWRYALRPRFLRNNETVELVPYYRARTLYFHYMSPLHETLISASSHKDLQGNKAVLQELDEREKQILRAWKTHGIAPRPLRSTCCLEACILSLVKSNG